MKKRVLLIFALAASAAAPVIRASTLPPPCPPSTSLQFYLDLPATGCTVEDKIFSDFDFSSSAQGGATAIVASGINVEPILAVDNPGLQFQANWSASSGKVSASSRWQPTTTD